ncbi:MAG: hypothetical protein WD770_04750 [Actinomycetota bacterium]
MRVARDLAKRSLMYLSELAVFVIGIVIVLDEAIFAPDCSWLPRCPGEDPCTVIMIGCEPRAMTERLLYGLLGIALVALALFALRGTWFARPRMALSRSVRAVPYS